MSHVSRLKCLTEFLCADKYTSLRSAWAGTLLAAYASVDRSCTGKCCHDPYMLKQTDQSSSYRHSSPTMSKLQILHWCLARWNTVSLLYSMEEAMEEQALLVNDEQAAARTRTHTESSEATSLELSSSEVFAPDRPLMAKMSLYASHLMSTWGQRMWEFAVGLIMLEMYPSTLALVSAFGLVDGLAKVLSGSFLGSYIDR